MRQIAVDLLLLSGLSPYVYRHAVEILYRMPRPHFVCTDRQNILTSNWKSWTHAATHLEGARSSEEKHQVPVPFQAAPSQEIRLKYYMPDNFKTSFTLMGFQSDSCKFEKRNGRIRLHCKKTRIAVEPNAKLRARARRCRYLFLSQQNGLNGAQKLLWSQELYPPVM